MAEYFPDVKQVTYEGPESKNPFAFKHYNAGEQVMGKSMAEHLRFAVCYWHTFKGLGNDPFGGPTMIRPYDQGKNELEVAENTMHAAFEFFRKLGVGFWCFHDVDIMPETGSLAEFHKNLDHIVGIAKQHQEETGIKLLWGTTNLFSHRRFLAGAATNPSPAVFAYAAAKVKKMLEVTKELGGAGYTFWGGREGYETILNTRMKYELDHLAKFLHMAVDYKKKIGLDAQFYIEPKPKEPTKHQYDFDAASCYAFLAAYDLLDHLKLNIEANHATLAGHSLLHELAFCTDYGILGSVDANRGDELLGWDTDQFPTNIYDTAMAMYIITKGGGFTTGGLNFDAKIRRQSIDPYDLFHAHIGAMDAFARGLKMAAKMIDDNRLQKIVDARYSGWNSQLGQDIEQGKVTFEDLYQYTLDHGEPEVQSGRQEMIENILNEYL
ncbi:MAG: xylose isomerase [Candidatus Hydrogenedentes bacterium]|nr:xylose isomerase [Candidatus Hydrogenedentota bacterium]